MANASIVGASQFSKHNNSILPLSTLRKMEGTSEMALLGESFDSSLLARMREDEYESRSGSDNFDGGSGDERDAADHDQPSNSNNKKKKYHRHTPHQIQELEAFFKECPHPDEKQRSDLSKRLGLENKQVKFWFQNRRTQMKTQLERHENQILRSENDALRAENSVLKEALANPICNNCNGPAIPGKISLEDHQMKIENARLKDELNRICAMAEKFLGRPISTLAGPMALQNPNPGLELGIGRNGMGGAGNFGMPMQMGLEMGDGIIANQAAMAGIRAPMGIMANEVQAERSMLIDIALAAMEELINMAQPGSPFWVKTTDGRKEVLNHEEYARVCPPYLGQKPAGFVTDATRETGIVTINTLALVDSLMDVDHWVEMFPSVVARAATLNVITSGVGGTRNGTLQLMYGEVQSPSPLIPVRRMTFLRFCKQRTEGIWAVVDVSVDIGANGIMTCRRLPSGCVIQEMPNEFCNITWVDHSQYDESVIHQLCRPLVSSGIAFGAGRWIATLQRQCENVRTFVSASIPSDDPEAICPAGRRNMLKLVQRMTEYFWSGIVCDASTRSYWSVLEIGTVGDDVKITARRNADDPGAAIGIVLCASTTIYLPVAQDRIFDFLRNNHLRNEWDMLSSGKLEERFNIAKGQVPGNCFSIFQAREASAIFLQDSWTDSSCSMVVYSPVEMQPLDVVMSGAGDPAHVALCPSGFAILPDGHTNANDGNGGGCLLTVGIQMMVSNQPASGLLTYESVDTVNKLISVTLQKIKDALGVA